MEALMLNIDELKVQYVTNDAGEKTGVILPIAGFQDLLEDIEDLAAIAERRDEPTIAHEQVLENLRQDGIL
jgi:hypothetical protein